MGAILGAVQGSYAYLLIFQIIVVTILLLFLLWLIARRLREFGEPETVPAAGDDSLVRVSTEQADRIKTLESQLSEMEKSGSSANEWKDKHKTLQDKVKFLEGKLLEYQILQEEIGALSVLKTENDNLKKLLAQAGLAVPASVDAPAPPPPAREIPPAPASAAEVKVELEAPSGGLKPFDDKSDLKPFDDKPDAPAAKAVAESLGQEEIDGLMSKLENLSKK